MKADYKVLIAALLVFIGLAAVFVLVDEGEKSSKIKLNSNENVNANASSNANANANAAYGSGGTVETKATGTTVAGRGGLSDGLVATGPTEMNSAEGRLQPFDPNTASAELLREVGLSDFHVRSILKYRARGGVYSSPEAFARVPGLTQGLYKKLKPYIRIAADFRPASELVASKTNKPGENGSRGGEANYPAKLAAGEMVSLNDADSLTLCRVPGIGPHYASRIISLRNRYGGFVSLAQLADIKGLPDDCYQYFYIPDGGIRKININKADFRKLQSHPYIGYNRARKIADYRRLKGKITSLQQLSLLEGFSEQECARLEPYIEF